MNHHLVDGRNAGLPAEDLAALRASLVEQRRFRREQLAPGGSAATDGTDGTRPDSRAEVHAALVASARMVLADVEAALERMEQGRYGTCHLCRRPVDLARLTVIPQARYCGRCQQVREAGR